MGFNLVLGLSLTTHFTSTLTFPTILAFIKFEFKFKFQECQHENIILIF